MSGKVNWSDKKWKQFIIEQRKHMWLPDTVEKLAKWLDLKAGTKVADIGCGLGYLGFTFWPYFGRNGLYCGIDVSDDLIQEAEELSSQWATEGQVDFRTGDAYKLDLADNSFDVVMCQTLLMHLGNPEKAIREMKRVLKPGGTIFCAEPDNLTHSTEASFNSALDETIEEKLLRYKTFYFGFKGRKKLKFGDNTIGNKLPMLLHQAGFEEIDIRKNDRVDFQIPPYDDDFKNRIKESYKKANGQNRKEEEKYWRNLLRRDVLAGGGSQYLLKKYFAMIENLQVRTGKTLLEQVEAEQYYACSSRSLYAAKAIKKKEQ